MVKYSTMESRDIEIGDRKKGGERGGEGRWGWVGDWVDVAGSTDGEQCSDDDDHGFNLQIDSREIVERSSSP